MNEDLEKKKFFVKLFMFGFFCYLIVETFKTGLSFGWW